MLFIYGLWTGVCFNGSFDSVWFLGNKTGWVYRSMRVGSLTRIRSAYFWNFRRMYSRKDFPTGCFGRSCWYCNRNRWDRLCLQTWITTGNNPWYCRSDDVHCYPGGDAKCQRPSGTDQSSLLWLLQLLLRVPARTQKGYRTAYQRDNGGGCDRLDRWK